VHILQDIALYQHFNKTLWKKVDAYGREKMRKDIDRMKKIENRGQRSSRNSNAVKQQDVNKLIVDAIDYQDYEETNKILDKQNDSKRASTSIFEKSLKYLNDEAMIELLQNRFVKNSHHSKNKEQFLELSKYMVKNHGGCPLLGPLA